MEQKWKDLIIEDNNWRDNYNWEDENTDDEILVDGWYTEDVSFDSILENLYRGDYTDEDIIREANQQYGKVIDFYKTDDTYVLVIVSK